MMRVIEAGSRQCGCLGSDSEISHIRRLPHFLLIFPALRADRFARGYRRYSVRTSTTIIGRGAGLLINQNLSETNSGKRANKRLLRTWRDE